MIINDKYKFFFMHIPKCAGTTVRALLEPFDDRYGLYTRRVSEHPDLGFLDFVHIPLFILRDYFPREFTNVCCYWSFAVVRDPFVRFPSSLSQRFNMYGKQPIQNQDEKAIKKELDRTIDYLVSKPNSQYLLPAEFIHFQKQIDYVYIGNEAIVNTLYNVGDIDALIMDVEEHIGEVLDLTQRGRVGAANRTVVYRNSALRHAIRFMRPTLTPVVRALPKSVKRRINELIFVPRDSRMKKLFSSDYVCDFVHYYYQHDIKLFEDVTGKRNWREVSQ